MCACVNNTKENMCRFRIINSWRFLNETQHTSFLEVLNLMNVFETINKIKSNYGINQHIIFEINKKRKNDDTRVIL